MTAPNSSACSGKPVFSTACCGQWRARRLRDLSCHECERKRRHAPPAQLVGRRAPERLRQVVHQRRR
ncbi:MAG: hypothetical protein EBT83_07125, partial [Betaproteobacteria bacterium]|nr:hypothetical protein [Betaproteobacteria bacterium]